MGELDAGERSVPRRRRGDDLEPRAPARVALVGWRRLLMEGVAAAVSLSDELLICAWHEQLQTLGGGTGPGGADVVVLDLDGVPADARAHARERVAPARLVLLADDVTEHVHLVLEQRADGLLRVTSGGRQVIGALRQVLDGQVVLPGGWSPQPSPEGEDRLGRLSDRQLEVLRLVAQGHTNDEVAERLYLSVNTVKFHLRAAYGELGIHNRVQAAAMLLAHPAG